MIKKTIEFTDFNGDKQVEDLYFNLTKAEVLVLEISGEGNSFHGQLQRMIKAENGKAIIETVKEILAKSYGRRSLDGKRFEKGPEITREFESSAAYSELLFELCTDADKSAEFMNGLLPKELMQQVNEDKKGAREKSEEQMQGFLKKAEPTVQKVETPTEITQTAEPVLEPTKILTRQQAVELPSEELRQKLAEGFTIS